MLISLRFVVLLCVLSVTGQAHAQQANESPLEAALSQLGSLEWGPTRDQLVVIDHAIAAGRDVESSLAKVITSDAPVPAKSYACRKLKEVGTSKSAPALATLLDDPELSHMARYALESIPSPEAGEMLREAVPRLEGAQLIGVIDSLGRRRDEEATTLLIDLVNNAEPAVVHASLIALARINAEQAMRVISSRIEEGNKDSIAVDACLRIAQQLLDAGQLEQALRVYRALEPVADRHVQLAVLRGFLLAAPEQAAERLIGCLQSEEDYRSRFAAQFIRENTSDSQINKIATAFPKLPFDNRVLLLDAIGERDHPAVRKIALESLDCPEEKLRMVAIEALAVSGHPEDVRTIISLATEASDAERRAVVETLAAMKPANVDTELLQLLSSSPPTVQTIAIDAIVERRTPHAATVLLNLTKSDESEVRIAALRALEQTADASAVDPLIEVLLEAESGKEQQAAERTLWLTCVRSSEEATRAAPLLSALAEATPAERAVLLPCVGRLGGAEALAVVQAARTDPDSDVRDAAVRAISNWPDDTVSEQMLEIAKHADQPNQRVQALRGYARVVARRGRTAPEKTFERLKQAMEIAERTEEQRLILSRLTAVRTLQALAYALSYIDHQELGIVAVDTTVSLAEAMKDSHPVEARAALEKAVQRTPDHDLQMYVTKLLWNMEQKGN